MDAGELLITIVFVAAVTLAFTLWSKRRSGSSWSGRVEKVDYFDRTHYDNDDDPGTSQPFVRIHARTDAGKRVKVELAQHAYHQLYPSELQPGERIVKKPGEWYPTREGSAG